MASSRWERIAPLSGLVFVALVVTGAALTFVGSPDFLPTSDEAVRYFEEHDGTIVAGGILGLVSTAALIWFAGTLSIALGRAEGGDRRLSLIAFGAGVAGAVALGAACTVKLAGGLRVDDSGARSRRRPPRCSTTCPTCCTGPSRRCSSGGWSRRPLR
jgi:hypothetical protein